MMHSMRPRKKHIDQLQLITYNPFVRAKSNKGAQGYGNSPLYRFKDQEILGHAYPHHWYAPTLKLDEKPCG